MSSDQTPTLIICLACGGDYEKVGETQDGKYKLTRCKWCSHGGMNREQVTVWKKYCEERRRSQS